MISILNKCIIIILLLITQTTIFCEISVDGNSEIQYKNIENNKNEFKLTLAKGNFVFNNFYKDMELLGNFEERVVFNERGIDIKTPRNFTALGLRYSYYGFKGFSLGIKGSLDYDHFIESNTNKYDFKQRGIDDYLGINKDTKEYLSNKTDFGLKLYGEWVYKPIKEIAVDLWSDIVIDKRETNKPIPDKDIQPTITFIPKIIYEKEIVEGLKILTELYVEARKYYGRTTDIEGNKETRYEKFAIKQHLMINKEFSKELKFSAYNNISIEKTYEAKNTQVVLRISPRLDYNSDRINAGIYGGEYRFDDEIGLTYDFYDLVGYKLVGVPEISKLSFKDYWKYESTVFSIKSFLEYMLIDNYWIGSEVAYKFGNFKEYVDKYKTNDGYLIQKTFYPYLKYEKNISDNITIKAKAGYESIVYNYKLQSIINNNNGVLLNLAIRWIF